MPCRPSSSIPAEPVPAGTGTSRQVLIGPDVGPNFALRKFVIEPGGGMPLHTNTVEHEQYVLGGRARVVIGDEVLEVKKDDVVYIPGGVPHSYEAMGTESFEFLCAVPNHPDQIKVIDPSMPESPEGTDDLVVPESPEGTDDMVVPEDELGC